VSRFIGGVALSVGVFASANSWSGWGRHSSLPRYDPSLDEFLSKTESAQSLHANRLRLTMLRSPRFANHGAGEPTQTLVVME
jgi:hypothetical protein